MKSPVKNALKLKKALMFLSCLLFLLTVVSCSHEEKVLIVTPAEGTAAEESPDISWMELRFYFSDDKMTESRFFIAYTDEDKAEYYYAQHSQQTDLKIEGNVVSYSLDITSYKDISAEELMEIYVKSGFSVRQE